MRQLLLVRRGPLRKQRARIVRDGERFFDRYGGRSVFLARWVVVARMTVPWLAGASRMPMRSFFVWNAFGGITWAASVALAWTGPPSRRAGSTGSRAPRPL